MLETLKKDDLVLFSNGDEAVVTDIYRRSDGWYNVYFNKRVYGTRQFRDNFWIYDKYGYPQFRNNIDGVSIIKVIHARESEAR